jgi:hypothetical protein
MATNLANHLPITMWSTISGNTELTLMPPEAAGQTFLSGTPTELVTGYSQAWSGTPSSNKIYGISLQPGANYATAGAGMAANFGQQGPPWSSVNIGAPPNQPSAVTIPYGAPFTTGGTLTMLAQGDTIFKAQYDTSEGATTISAGAVSSVGVLTATASNAHFVGEQIVLSGFTGNGLPLNGLTAIVLTVTGGPPSTGYTAQLSSNPGTISATGAGTDNPTFAPTQQMVGLAFGLTIDGNGSWYIDGSKTTSGTNTVLVVTGLYQASITEANPFVEVPNGQLLFRFQAAAITI